MLSVSHSSATHILRRARQYQWYWNNAFDPWSTNDEQWQKFTDIENEIIEDAYNEKRCTIEIDGDYIINFECLLRYKKSNVESSACPIKRIQFDKDRSHIRAREDRFLLPVTLVVPTDSYEHSQNVDELDELQRNGYITRSYWILELQSKKKTIADIVDDAAHGIITEGTAIDKIYEAQWISQQLISVKDFGDNIDVNFIRHFPLQIGETCAYLYTKESFLYKLINRTFRNSSSITREQIQNLGPFCWLLDWYLYDNSTRDIPIVYRSLDLTDQQRKEFMQEIMKFTAFTSTTCNRSIAEFYDGNTLLIIDLDQYESTVCGKNISSVSDFPEEEEFLIWPGRDFAFVKYEYDISKKKHMIYLKSLSWID